MTVLDVLLCFALTYRMHTTNASMWATAKRLRGCVDAKTEAALVVDTVLNAKHPRAVMELVLEDVE